MIRMCPICTLDVHDYYGSGKLRHHNDGEGERCPGSATVTDNLSAWELRRDLAAPSGAEDETASGSASAHCPTCTTRPADLTTDQQQWRHHHCSDNCPGHWAHTSNPNPTTCGGAP